MSSSGSDSDVDAPMTTKVCVLHLAALRCSLALLLCRDIPSPFLLSSLEQQPAHRWLRHVSLAESLIARFLCRVSATRA